MRNAALSAWTLAGWVLLLTLGVSPAPVAAAQDRLVQLDDYQRAEAFRAAGAVQRGGRWLLCPRAGEDEGDASIGDIAGLGDYSRLAVIVSGPTAGCAGKTGSGFRLLERDPQGQWKLVYSGSGGARLDPGEGPKGQPRLMLLPDHGGCRSVLHWNGDGWQADSDGRGADAPGSCGPPA